MTVMAVGKFDALHLGHRALALQADVLLRLTGMAEAFAWSQRDVITAEADRGRVLAQWRSGLVERAVDIAGLRALDGAGFVAWLRRMHAASVLVVGADFRCGRGRACGVAELGPLCRAQGMRLEVVEAVQVDDLPVSSTRVRQALESGDCAAAAACLGRQHRLLGTVRRGDGRGRTLGFPTANLAVANQVPATGVYAAWAELSGRRVPAALNIGTLPTIAAGRTMSVEAHLIGWSGDCYDMVLALDLVQRLRPEQRFDSLEALRTQIASDVQQTAVLLSSSGA